jgi:hypothetical protein
MGNKEVVIVFVIFPYLEAYFNVIVVYKMWQMMEAGKVLFPMKRFGDIPGTF